MGLMDFIKGELIDVIEWTDDSRDTLSFRFPDDDKAIKNGAQLIVRESQCAQFVYLGQFGDSFRPGKHALTTGNIPVQAKLAYELASVEREGSISEQLDALAQYWSSSSFSQTAVMLARN